MFRSIDDQREWKSVIDEFESRDFYHTWDFHKISECNGEGKPLLLLYEGDECQIAWPLLLRTFYFEGELLRDASSAYGYPGPLFRGEVSADDRETWTQEIRNWCRDHRVVSIFSRMNPLIDSCWTIEELGNIVVKGITIPIDLRVSEDLQRESFRSSLKRGVNKLSKQGATCVELDPAEHLETFIRLYESTMDAREARECFYFNRDYYERLFSAEDFTSRLYGVIYEGQVVCAGIFVFTGKIVQYHLGGTDKDYYRLAPSKLLFDQVRMDASKRGMEWFMLGGGLGSEDDQLLYFKAGFSKLKLPFRVANIIIDTAAFERLKNRADRLAEASGLPIHPELFHCYRAVPDTILPYRPA
jgi:hypothetical protein